MDSPSRSPKFWPLKLPIVREDWREFWRRWTAADINIEYMYAFPYSRANEAILIFRFSDLDAAIARLQAAGINLVTSEELLT